MESCILTRKAQVWSIDLAIAIVIFLIGITMMYFYALNYTQETEDKLEVLFYDGNNVGEILLSPGYPEDWTVSDVVTPGILSENKINQTKLDNFNSLNYDEIQRRLNTNYELFFNFSEPMYISGAYQKGIGRDPLDYSPRDIVKVSRFTIYQNKPVRIDIFIWDD
ncbi:MAG: hypothetical protein ABIH72_01595 [archaeon]